MFLTGLKARKLLHLLH